MACGGFAEVIRRRSVRTINRIRINIEGIVQGVGFRPFIYRLAKIHGLSGWVKNTNEGVETLVWGNPGDIEQFLPAIRRDAPAASDIWEVTISEAEIQPSAGFEIRGSEDISEAVTEISPDIAVCPECMQDISTQENRILYPFVNCTHCGPRFSIIREIPYDRPMTSMAAFPMCSSCRIEYEDPADRRFHAQPNACPVCGPRLRLCDHRGRELPGDPLAQALSALRRGEIVAVKGLSLQSLYHFTIGGPVEDRRLMTLPPYVHLNR